MKRTVFTLAIALLLMAQRPTTQSDIVRGLVGVALGEFGGSKVSEIIKQLQGTGEALIREGGNTGNSLLVTTGSEMQAFLANASYILRDSQNRLYKDIGFNQQAILAVTLILRDQVRQSQDFARDFLDSTKLSLDELVDRLPFVKDQFYIQSFRGMVLLHKSQGEYHFRLMGTKLQPYFAGRAVEFELKACNPEHRCDRSLPTRVVLGTQAAAADLFVSASAVEPYFLQDRMSVLDAEVTIRLSKIRRGRVTDTEVHPVPIHFSLLPELAGTGTASGAIEELGWRPINNPDVPRVYANPNPLVTDNYDCYTRPGDDCDHPDHYRKDLTLPRLAGGAAGSTSSGPAVGARRYTNVKLECGPPTHTEIRRITVGGGGGREGGGGDRRTIDVPTRVLSPCIWSSNSWHYVDTDQTEVIANIDTFSHPATITFSAVVEEYRKTGERAWSSGPIEFRYGKSLDIEVPAHYASLPHFVGRTLQHRDFDFVLSQPGPGEPFSLVGPPERKSDGSLIVHYTINRPDWDNWN